ncbi:MAG: hypothetical protein EOO45_05510 [Flavobacterium sp.]|nr:MAG: hypothetical protein EOO45_05510 [Flavobacterium sp.]
MGNYQRVLFGIIIIFSLALIVIYFRNSEIGCAAPERVKNIPKDAVWKGGVDGGFWFQAVSRDSLKAGYRFRIYSDYNGELIIDADFVANCRCTSPIDKIIH